MHCDLVFTTVTEWWVQIMGSHPLPLASGAGACAAGTQDQMVCTHSSESEAHHTRALMHKTCPVPFPVPSLLALVVCPCVGWWCASSFVAVASAVFSWLAVAGRRSERTPKAEVMFSTDIAHALLAQLQAKVNEHARAGFGLPIFLQVSCVSKWCSSPGHTIRKHWLSHAATLDYVFLVSIL